MRRVSMKRIKEVLKLRYLMDFSFRQIGKSIGISPSTAQDYCKRFEILPDKLEEFTALDEEIQYAKLFPEHKAIAYKTKRPKPDVEYIDKEIRKRGVTYLLLWQEYKEQHPDGYGYTQFKAYHHKYKKSLNPSMRQIHLSGEKLFVDYSGMTVPIYDQVTGEVTQAQIFVAVLGASGYTFVDASPSQKQEHFIKSHIRAFEFFDGVPKIVVPDNLKSAVIKNNKDGLILNESYKAMADHYGCVIEPARPKKPKDKAKAEQGVQAIQRWILAVLRNRKFFSIESLNDAIGTLLDRYNAKVMKKPDKSRDDLFEELDKPFLQPLVANSYIYKEFKIATVNIDYHIELHQARYSVPYQHIGKKVEVRYTASVVEIYHGTKLIATHPRNYAHGYNTIIEHMPKTHQYQEEKYNPERYLRWAKSIGAQAEAFTQMLFAQVTHPSHAYRKLNGIFALTKLYGNYELNLALEYAHSINTTKVSSIKSILSKKLYYKKAVNNIFNSALNNHENIRGSAEYK